jgi:hypothetical protein
VPWHRPALYERAFDHTGIASVGRELCVVNQGNCRTAADLIDLQEWEVSGNSAMIDVLFCDVQMALVKLVMRDDTKRQSGALSRPSTASVVR